jgi:murein DD-endopeptidase MepM/ murein hydrolase activator NlpD
MSAVITRRTGGLWLWAAAAALTGCATTRAEPPPPHFQPYQLAPQAAKRVEPLPPPPPPATEKTVPSIRLNAALLKFTLAQRATREAFPKGTALPPESNQSWALMLASVDEFLAQPTSRLLALDVVRARVGIDAELDMDRGWFTQVPSNLAAAVKARAMGLDQKLGQVRRLAQKPSSPAAPLVWPLSPVVVTSLYGLRTDPFDGAEKVHQGVDLKARSGQLVQAAGPGVVLRAAKKGGHGLHVEIMHDDGLVTGYSHLSMILVSTGMRIPTGGAVGLAGSTGRSTGPHLHFEVWRRGRPVDPLAELVDPALQEISTDNVGAGE